MKKPSQKPTIKEEASKFGQGFLGIFRAIPKWIYVAFIPLLLGIGGTVLVYEMNEISSLDLPKTQIINDQMLTDMYAFDGRTKNPSWVMQIMSPGDARESMSNVKFNEDTSIPLIMRPTLSDYKNSGYDIAHLLNASDQGAFSTQFSLSTASPQLPQFNRVYWAKVDNYVRELVKKLDVNRVLVVTGPLYLPHTEKDGKRYVSYQVIGDGNVAVPTHFFKIIYYPVENPDLSGFTVSSEAYIVPNQDLDENVPLDSFRTSLENLEKISGIILPTDIKSYLVSFTPPPKM
jgi:endonuclease G